MKFKTIIVALAVAIAPLCTHAQTYTVVNGSSAANNTPWSTTLLLNYRTVLGIYADMQLTDNFSNNSGYVSFGNTPVGNTYLGGGTLQSQTLAWTTFLGVPEPSSTVAVFEVADVKGYLHTVTLDLNFTYANVTINRWTKRVMRNVIRTVTVQ